MREMVNGLPVTTCESIACIKICLHENMLSLNERLVRSSIDRLENYLNNKEKVTMLLLLGDCWLEVENIDQAKNALEVLNETSKKLK